MSPKIVHFISADGLNKESDENLAVAKNHMGHPCIVQYCNGFPFLPTGTTDSQDPFGTVGVALIKFQNGLHTAYIGRDEQGNWGAGPWIGAWRFTADEYFGDAKPHESLAGALDDLYARRPGGLARGTIWFVWAGN